MFWKKEEYIGEVYGRSDNWIITKRWIKFNKDDIVDKVDNKIKIKTTCDILSDYIYAVWYDLSDVIFYDDIYNSQRKKIKNKYKEEK